MGHEREDKILRDRVCSVSFNLRLTVHARTRPSFELLDELCENVSTCEIQFKFPFQTKKKTTSTTKERRREGGCEQGRGCGCIESNALSGPADV